MWNPDLKYNGLISLSIAYQVRNSFNEYCQIGTFLDLDFQVFTLLCCFFICWEMHSYGWLMIFWGVVFFFLKNNHLNLGRWDTKDHPALQQLTTALCLGYRLCYVHVPSKQSLVATTKTELPSIIQNCNKHGLKSKVKNILYGNVRISLN